ncbi:hypothetical protein TNCV_4838201 [Trichonephila clavipes]|nr:hypothetical protein TNCV_4838201 [Trichonephila clavipes]
MCVSVRRDLCLPARHSASQDAEEQRLIVFLPGRLGEETASRPLPLSAWLRGGTNENKIDGERQRASASAQNGWRKRDGSRHEKEPKKGEGRDNKRRQSQPGRDMGGAKHETGFLPI